MITGKDILNAWLVWKSAGLIPPNAGTPAELQAMTESMLKQYGGLEPETWQKVINKLSHGSHWPRFADIDTAVKELKPPPEEPQAQQPINRKANLAKMHAIIEHIGKHGSFDGLLQPPSPAVIEYAKKIFPDCDMDFIKRNYCDIAAVQKQDTICELCKAGVLPEGCPVYGHKQFLRIDKRGGNTYICADSNICSRYSRSV